MRKQLCLLSTVCVLAMTSADAEARRKLIPNLPSVQIHYEALETLKLNQYAVPRQKLQPQRIVTAPAKPIPQTKKSIASQATETAPQPKLQWQTGPKGIVLAEKQVALHTAPSQAIRKPINTPAPIRPQTATIQKTLPTPKPPPLKPAVKAVTPSTAKLTKLPPLTPTPEAVTPAISEMPKLPPLRPTVKTATPSAPKIPKLPPLEPTTRAVTPPAPVPAPKLAKLPPLNLKPLEPTPPKLDKLPLPTPPKLKVTTKPAIDITPPEPPKLPPIETTKKTIDLPPLPAPKSNIVDKKVEPEFSEIKPLSPPALPPIAPSQPKKESLPPLPEKLTLPDLPALPPKKIEAIPSLPPVKPLAETPSLPPLPTLPSISKTAPSLPPIKTTENDSNLPPLPELPLDAPPALPELPALPSIDSLGDSAPNKALELTQKHNTKNGLPPLPTLPGQPSSNNSFIKSKDIPKLAALDIPDLPPLPVKKDSSASPADSVTSQGKPATTIAFSQMERAVPLTSYPELKEVAEQVKQDENKGVTILAYAYGSDDQSQLAKRAALARMMAVRTFLIEEGGLNQTQINAMTPKKSANPDGKEHVDIFIR